MKITTNKRCAPFSEAFFGTATVGERGQIVIPSDARAERGFLPGDKILILRHPIHTGLMLFKLEAVNEFLEDFAQDIKRLNEKLDGQTGDGDKLEREHKQEMEENA